MFIHPDGRWLIPSLHPAWIHSCVQSVIYELMNSCVRSFDKSFICSIIHSCMPFAFLRSSLRSVFRSFMQWPLTKFHDVLHSCHSSFNPHIWRSTHASAIQPSTRDSSWNHSFIHSSNDPAIQPSLHPFFRPCFQSFNVLWVGGVKLHKSRCMV